MSISVEACTFSYAGSGAGVRDVSLGADDGELIAIIGASGSGKTTILKLVAGFERPDSGKIVIRGRDVTDIPARGRGIGVVFQSYALFPMMRCVDNVAYPLKIRGIPGRERRKSAMEMLEKVGLSGYGDRYPAQLSGGQQQRVALARALVFRPSVLLLDEPLSAIDAGLRTELRKQIRQLQREHRITALHVTHDQEEALSMGDKVALLDAGRVVQCATPQEIYDAPVNRKVASFVGQANLWDGEVAGEDLIRVAFGSLRCDAGRFASGARVTVLVRPENVRINPESASRPNCFAGKVALDAFLGSVRRFEFAPRGFDGMAIMGETSDRSPIAGIYMPEDGIRLLPGDSIV